MSNTNWFDVDKKGLAKLMEGRSKAFILFELLQNAWDQNVTKVAATLGSVHGHTVISVLDDDPEGFADLRDAFTLFAESKKKRNPTQRGRFNLGEKLVLALATQAKIETTKGTVIFSKEGRHTTPFKRPSGSRFEAWIKMKQADVDQIRAEAKRLLPPVPTTIDGDLLEPKAPLKSFTVSLPTVIANEDGVLVKTARVTQVDVHRPDGGTGWLYEMGIPVVETGDEFSVNVHQKVPLNMDRDNVTPAYLRAVRVAVLNNTHDLVQDVTSTWVKEAASDERVNDEAVKKVVNERFGENAVRYDPSDPESNQRVVEQGRPVVYGRTLSADEWANVNRVGLLPPAGKVAPTPKPFSEGGRPLKIVEEWDRAMVTAAKYARDAATALLKIDLTVVFVDDKGWAFQGTFGADSCRLHINVAQLKNLDTDSVEFNSFLIHEFGHYLESNHLSERYHQTLCDLGAKLMIWRVCF